MYKKKKLLVNIYYKEDGNTILDILEQDFKDFFHDYVKNYLKQ